MALNLGELFQDFSSQFSLLTQQQDEALKNVQQLQTEAGAVAARGTDARGYTALQVQTEGLAKLEAQSYIQDYLGNLDYRAQMGELAKAHRAVSAQELVLRSKLSEESSVSIFDDPLQAVVNAFTIPWTKQALGAKAGEAKSIADTMDEMNRLATDTARATLATTNTVTAASVKDAVDATAANIERLQLEANTKAAVTNAERVAKVMTSTKEQLSVQLQVESIAEQRKARELQSQALQFQLDKIKDERSAAKFDLALINKGAKDLGGQEWSEEVYANRKGVGDPAIAFLRERGWQLLFGGANQGQLPLGKDVIDTEEKQARFGFTDPEREDTQRILKIRDESKAKILTAHKDDPKKARAFMQAQFEADLAERETWKPGDDSNPLRPAAWKLVAENQFVKADPLWQKYVAPTITRDNELKTMNPQELARILVRAAKTDGVSLSAINIATSTVLNNNANQVEFYTSGWKQTRLLIPTDRMARIQPTIGLIPGIGVIGVAAGSITQAVNPAYDSATNWMNDAERANWLATAYARYSE
jgi:hypothetical protein